MNIELTNEPVFKFRAWDIRRARMIENALLLTETRQLVTVDEDFNNAFAFFDGCKWMPFIGRKDRNNKDIYSGDFVRFFENGKEFIKEVIISENGIAPFAYFVGTLKEFEVVGNIFENPELKIN